jgi:phosphoglycerol transferase MdoB-like AlkP superfamily enzyme
MSKRQFVTVCFRMFAVYLALAALTNIPYIYTSAIAFYDPIENHASIVSIFMAILISGLSLVLPWLFWKKSDYLMIKVFGDKDFFVDENGESKADGISEESVKFNFSADEVLVIGLTLMGCWILADSILPAIRYVLFMFETNGDMDTSLSRKLRDAVGALGTPILGYILIKKASSIVVGLRKTQS